MKQSNKWILGVAVAVFAATVPYQIIAQKAVAQSPGFTPHSVRVFFQNRTSKKVGGGNLSLNTVAGYPKWGWPHPLKITAQHQTFSSYQVMVKGGDITLVQVRSQSGNLCRVQFTAGRYSVTANVVSPASGQNTVCKIIYGNIVALATS